jgi:hypothetical protein
MVSSEPLPKRLIELNFMDCIPANRKKAKPQKKRVVCTKHGKRRETVFIGVVNVKQGCVWMDVSRPATQTSNSIQLLLSLIYNALML